MIHTIEGVRPDLTVLPSGDRWSTTEDGLERAALLMSDRTGIVSRVFDKVHDLDDSFTYAIGSETADGEHLIGASSNTFNGGGDPSAIGTYLAAVGECVERYSAAWVPWDHLWRTTYRELVGTSAAGVDPDTWTPFHAEQLGRPDFAYGPLTEDLPIHWSQMQDLASGDPVWVPSQMLYLYPTEPHHEGGAVGYSTSSGLAFHSSPAEAILGGLYELIERDAFMVAWYSGLSMPLIDVAGDPELARFMRRHVEPSGVDVKLVDLTEISGVPTVLGVARNDHTDLATVALGAAAGPTLRGAARDAAIESLQTRNWIKAEQREGDAIDPQTCDFHRDIRSFDDHIRLYAGAHAREMAGFLTSSTDRVDVVGRQDYSARTPNEEIRGVVDHLAQQGIRTYAADLTSPDVLEARGAVFKVFSPDLQMLDVGYHRRYLGSERLRTVAHALGRRPGPLTPDDLNPLPHPFP